MDTSIAIQRALKDGRGDGAGTWRVGRLGWGGWKPPLVPGIIRRINWIVGRRWKLNAAAGRVAEKRRERADWLGREERRKT